MDLNTQYNLALEHYNKEEYNNAILVCDSILQVDQNHYHSWNLLGNTYFKLKQLDAAKDFFIAALKLKNDSIESYYMLGNVLFQGKLYEDAINIWKEALRIKNDFTLAYANIAIAYHSLEKIEDSLFYCQETLKIEKNNLDALLCSAKNYQYNLDLKNTKKYLQKVLLIDKTNALAAFDLAYVYLYEENYLKGFTYFEHRKNMNNRKKEYDYLPFKKLEEQSLKNKSLLIYHEQGFGDNIQFIRFVNDLECKNISIGVQNALNKLFSYNFPNIKFLSEIKSSDKYDYMLALMSIPFYLKLEKLNTNKEYLDVKKEDILEFKEKNLKEKTFNIGLTWKGSKKNKSSLKLDELELLLNIKNTNFHSLQIEENEEAEKYNISDLGSSFKNFYDTAVAIKSMDLIISVDTAVAHLAGALGVSTFVIYKDKNFDFRWLLKNQTSIWYNSIRIYNKDQVTQIKKSIEELVRNK